MSTTTISLGIGTTLAIGLFAAAAQSAGNSYEAFTAGDPDIVGNRSQEKDVTAMQPSIGADLDRYHGIADGNGDLMFDLSGSNTTSGENPNIYHGFKGPDQSY